MLIGALIVVYVLAWLVLLVDCIRRKRFYPLLGPGRATRIFWLATFLFFNPVLTLLYFLFGCLKQPRERAAGWATGLVVLLVVAVAGLSVFPIRGSGTRAFTLKQDELGEEVVVEGEKDRRFPGFHLAKFESQNNISSASSTASSDQAAFACRRVAILNNSRHRLMTSVGALLADRLAKLPFIETLEYYPADQYPEPATLAPDMVITLSASRIAASRLPTYLKVSADVEVTADSVPWSGPGGVTFSSETPPVLQVRWNGQLQHESKTGGYESPAVKYGLAAADVAKQIGETLAKAFGDWHAKFGPMPDLPDVFFGPYKPPVVVPFAGWENCSLLFSHYGLYENNRTVWRLEDDRDTADALADLQEQLAAAGWQESSDYDAYDNTPQLRMKKDTLQIVAFRRKQPPAVATVEWHTPGSRKTPQQPIIVCYTEPCTPEKRCQALEHLLLPDVPLDTILRFERGAWSCSREFRDRLLARLEEARPTTAAAYLSLAYKYHERDMLDKARSALVRAIVLARVHNDPSKQKSKLKDLAEKLGDENLVDLPISQEVLDDLGFVELTPDVLPLEREVEVNEPLLLSEESESGETIFRSVRIIRGGSTEGEPPYQLLYAEIEPRGGFTSVTTGLRAGPDQQLRAMLPFSAGDFSVRATGEMLKDGRFRITLKAAPY